VSGTCTNNVNLVVGLGLHACRRRHEHELRNEVKDLGQRFDRVVVRDRRQELAEAREELNAVVEADDTGVARIWLESVGFHHMQTSGRDRQANAAIRFAAQAQMRARRLSQRATFQAAAVQVPLTHGA
jgi:hypothetical protein